jgi:hypothetical protein
MFARELPVNLLNAAWKNFDTGDDVAPGQHLTMASFYGILYLTEGISI